MQRLLILCATAAVLLGEQPTFGRLGNRATAQSSIDRAAAGDVELLVRQALEDRLAAKNVPDGNLLGSSTRIGIREEMPKAGMKLGREALPQREGYEFFLISLAEAQAEADQSGKPVHVITVDRPSLAEDTATLWLGVDVAFPREPKVIKLCCCTGQGQFRRVEGRWRFVKWASMVCS
jgi:hypothetical protein